MIDLLNDGGRICIITFHSLEDRIVKSNFKKNENPCTCPSNFPVCVCGKKSKGRVVTRKPVLPSEKELEENSRSKSAKLRVFERVEDVDNEMMTALCLAAKSGVDVRIMTPGIPDKKMVFLLTQSYYKQLLEAGVKIYEYQPGFLHAKSFVCDDKVGVVGTINLDYRSLYLHFEDGVWMYKNDVILDIRDDFLETLEYCNAIDLEFCKKRNIIVRAIQNVLRVFAPLL